MNKVVQKKSKGIYDNDWSTIFNHYLSIQKRGQLSKRKEVQLLWLLQIDVLGKYFGISNHYIDKKKIREEVKVFLPSWTGYEDFFWYCYHYEAFCNTMYSYIKTWAGFIKSWLSISKDISDKKLHNSQKVKNVSGLSEIISTFYNQKSVRKVIQDRGESVHSFGQWRPETARKYLGSQNWSGMMNEIKTLILNTLPPVNTFHRQMSKVIIKNLR